MQDNFTKDFFAGNRERLRQLFTGTAPIVLTANGLLQRNGDSPFRFRQDSNFWYLTGIDQPDVVLVMDKGKEYLIVPERDMVREAFDGKIDAEALTRRSGVAEVYVDKAGWKKLGRRLKSCKHVAVLAPATVYDEWHGIYNNPARTALDIRIKSYNTEVELLDLRDHLMQMRVIKQPQEMVAIQRAIDVTIEGLEYVSKRNRLASYQYEYEIEADLARHFRRADCGHAFDSIVAGGLRACQMHNVENSGQLSADELLLFDVGAEYSLYAADISRTISHGEPTRRQIAVHKAVCDVQDYAYTLLKPGIVHMEYEKQVEMYMGEKLRELGVIKTITHDAVRKYFPHLMSHYLGLDTHDVGDYRKAMRSGMVMVAEAGIYLPEEGIGVRIEDCLTITDTGHRVLSNALSRELIV